MQLISRTPTRSYFVTLFLVVALLFCIFSAVIYRNYMEAQRLNHWTLYNYEVIRQSRKLLIDLVDMETGVRGYLLTGKKKFLQPYNESKITLNREIKALWTYTKEDPSTQNNIESG